jgi:hypothetical protein
MVATPFDSSIGRVRHQSKTPVLFFDAGKRRYQLAPCGAAAWITGSSPVMTTLYASC